MHIYYSKYNLIHFQYNLNINTFINFRDKNERAKQFYEFRKCNVEYINEYIDAVICVSKRVATICQNMGIDSCLTRCVYIGTRFAESQWGIVRNLNQESEDFPRHMPQTLIKSNLMKYLNFSMVFFSSSNRHVYSSADICTQSVLFLLTVDLCLSPMKGQPLPFQQPLYPAPHSSY